MFTRFKKPQQALFLDPDLDVEIAKEGGIDVILSPALYWVKRFTLPSVPLKEAKKLLPSLFEEFLPQGEYRYYGYFDEDRFVGFAYDEERIKAVLESKGVPLSRVDKIYFAQNELDKDALPCKIGEWVLAEVDGVVIKLPASFASQAKALDPRLKPHTAHKITIERYTKLIDRKTLYGVLGVCMLFLAAYGAEFYKLHIQRIEIEKAKGELFSRYGLLPTTFQNEALLKKYEKIDTRQRKIRSLLAEVLRMPLPKGVYLSDFRLHKKRVQLLFVGVERKEALLKRLKRLKEMKSVYHDKSKKLQVEVAL